jgi:integrase
MTTTTTTTKKKRERPPQFDDGYLRKFSLEPDETEAIVFEAKGTGLGIRVTGDNHISFITQLRLDDGRKWRETIGPWGKFTVEQARKAVKVRAGKIALGLDPFEEKAKKVAALKAKAEAEKAKAEAEEIERFTLRVLVGEWKKRHLVRRRPAYKAKALANLTRPFEDLLDVPAVGVTAKEVGKIVDRLAERAEASARNSAVAIKGLYRWGLKKHLIETNPLADLELPERGGDRSRTLSADEARRVFSASFRLNYPGGPLIRLLMLTGARRGEIAALKWSEIETEEDGQAIVLPPERTKNNSGHHIPLSAAALDVLAECRRNAVVGCKFVFSSDGWRAFGNFGRVKEWLDEALAEDGAPIPQWVLHDLRRTLVSTLARKPFRFAPHVLDRLLGHQVKSLSAVARIYQQEEFHDLRREALEAWCRFLTQPPATVVDLKQRRS